jgi:hypothetical protein
MSNHVSHGLSLPPDLDAPIMSQSPDTHTPITARPWLACNSHAWVDDAIIKSSIRVHMSSQSKQVKDPSPGSGDANHHT